MIKNIDISAYYALIFCIFVANYKYIRYEKDIKMAQIE